MFSSCTVGLFSNINWLGDNVRAAAFCVSSSTKPRAPDRSAGATAHCSIETACRSPRRSRLALDCGCTGLQMSFSGSGVASRETPLCVAVVVPGLAACGSVGSAAPFCNQFNRIEARCIAYGLSLAIRSFPFPDLIGDLKRSAGRKQHTLLNDATSY